MGRFVGKVINVQHLHQLRSFGRVLAIEQNIGFGAHAKGKVFLRHVADFCPGEDFLFLIGLDGAGEHFGQG